LPKINKPMTRIVIDRTVSDVPLSKGAYIEGDGVGYGLLEQWIGRLGYYTIRLEGKDAFSGKALVVICPDLKVTASFSEQLKRYVAEGGKLLVFDSPENAKSTANSLLKPFGLSIKQEQPVKGALTMVDKWPGIDVPQALEVVGGRPVARIGERTVAAIAQHGKGTVLAVGFSSMLNDKLMGGEAQWMVEPDAALRLRYEVLYALVRLLVENKPIAPPGVSAINESGKSKSQLQLPELPMLEHGLRE